MKNKSSSAIEMLMGGNETAMLGKVETIKKKRLRSSLRVLKMAEISDFPANSASGRRKLLPLVSYKSHSGNEWTELKNIKMCRDCIVSNYNRVLKH